MLWHSPSTGIRRILVDKFGYEYATSPRWSRDSKAQVLEYFDAYLIRLTATPDNRTYGFFGKNVVSEHGHETAVADDVNVGNVGTARGTDQCCEPSGTPGRYRAPAARVAASAFTSPKPAKLLIGTFGEADTVEVKVWPLSSVTLTFMPRKR